MTPEVTISGPRRCPRCRSTRVVPMEYGLPPIEIAPQADRGEIVLGGCCVADGDPMWHCTACGADFGYYRAAGGSGGSMRKARTKAVRRSAVREDTMLPEYDFSKGRRGVTAARYAQGSNIIVLEPDVAAAFPDAASVNEALRALIRVARTPKPTRRRARA